MSHEHTSSRPLSYTDNDLVTSRLRRANSNHRHFAKPCPFVLSLSLLCTCLLVAKLNSVPYNRHMSTPSRQIRSDYSLLTADLHAFLLADLHSPLAKSARADTAILPKIPLLMKYFPMSLTHFDPVCAIGQYQRWQRLPWAKYDLLGLALLILSYKWVWNLTALSIMVWHLGSPMAISLNSVLECHNSVPKDRSLVWHRDRK